MRRKIPVVVVICALTVLALEMASGATTPKAASLVPNELKAQIDNTLNSTNLRVEDVNEFVEKGRDQSSVDTWDYQSPDRAESIPRRYLVSRQDYGFQIEVGDSVVDHFSIGPFGLGTGSNLTSVPKYVGLRFPPARGQWTNVQSQLFAPLIDALDGNRYAHSKNTYTFSTKGGIRGRVEVNGRRVVSAQITYFQSLCAGKAYKYRESELFYGVHHFEMVALPPTFEIQYAKAGRVTQEKANGCK